MRRAALVFATALVTVSAATACRGAAAPGAGGAPAHAGERSRALPVLPLGGDFELIDHHGRPFALASLRGSVVLVFFGYTMCPDACPTTLSKLSTAYARLSPEERARVKTVYITVDPERDTSEVMRAHLTYFGVDAIGLTGTPDDIARVAGLFKAHYERSDAKTAGGYLMSHTVSVFGLDALGRTRTIVDYEASVDLVLAEVRALLDAVPAGEAAAAPPPSSR